MATLKELAELVEGTVVGDPAREIVRLAPIDGAGPGDITFVANPKYLAKLKDTRATAVVVGPGVKAAGPALIVCENPYLAFAKILTFLHVRRPKPQGVLPGAHVHVGAHLAEDVTVHPGCAVGDRVRIGKGSILYPGVILYEGVTVGEDCTLHAGVVVREGCRIGNRVIIQPNAVIGSDGFGYAPDGQRYFKIPQVGIVVLEDDVEIGASTCIDRAAMEVTRIGRGTKIDNLVQLAHNVKVGEDTVLVAQVGVAGSAEIGNHCTLGGQVGVAGHLKIGDNVMIGGQSGVVGDVASGQVLSGSPVMPHRDWLKAAKSFGHLPELRKEVLRLKKQLAELEMQLKEK